MDTVTELFVRAADLGEDDRAALAGLLIESLESESPPDIGEAWAAEIDSRLAELDSGQVESIPWEKLRNRLLSGRRGP